MARTRQNITITSKVGNRRIEAAIPKFKARYGWDTDQATAVAIRLESVGRLHGDGIVSRSTKAKGAAGMAAAALAYTPRRKRRTTRGISRASMYRSRRRR